MSDKRLGIEIQTNAASANKELNTMVSALNQVSTSLQKAGYAVKSVKTITDSMGQYKKAVVTASNANVTLKQTIDKLGKTTGIQTITKHATNAKSAFSKMFDFGKIYAFWNVTKRIRDGIKQMINSAVAFIETTNKFEVSMGDMEQKGYKFINKISEQFGLAREELMNYQSTYNNIMKSLPGITEKAAYSISESITKMAIDYASLYNVATEESMTKFQSALVGSVRPIRSESGYDITETTIGQKAAELGVETPVRQLNQMEKRLLRIIVLMDQMKKTGAMGDFARTIEQPANQLKILSNQLQELGVWLGNVFMGTLGKILPYINGFVMALKEMAKMLALFVGYENVGSIADPLQDASDTTGNISSNLGGAVKKAKELKKTLMGFDVLNVIQTPKDSSGGGGGGADLGVDPKILKAMKEYDNLMEGVTMKATKIRDRIMEWLGFTKLVNEETGEVSWELGEGYTNIEKIYDALKIIVGSVILIKLIKGIVSIIKGLSKVKAFLFGTKAAAGASAGAFAKMSGAIKNAFSGIKNSIKWIGTAISKVTGWIGGLLAPLGALGGVIGGILLAIPAAIWGAAELSKPIADLSTETLLFDKNISNATKNAVQPFMKKMNELGTTIWSLELGSIVTDKDVAKVKQKTQEIADTLQKGISDKYNELKSKINDTELFPDVTKRQEYLSLLDASMKEEQTLVKFYNDKINEIVGNAAKQNRELTQEERVEIEGIRKQMANKGIETLSKSQEEAIKIKSKFNTNFYKLEVQQVADAIKQAKELKDKTVKEAQEEYDKKIALAEKMKETVPGFTQEMYDQMTKDAKTELDKQLKNAEDTYNGIVKEAQEKYPEVTKTIDLETGKIKNGWQIAGDAIKTTVTKIGDAFAAVWKSAQEGASKKLTKLKQDFEDFQKSLGNKIDKIKEKWNSFRNNFKLPNIKMPHFTWTTTPAKGATKKILEALGLPASMPKLSVSWYAKGGLPDVGEMFVAREAGPELVGTIGNKSAVVNNDQIVQAVSQGVAAAVSSVMGATGGSYHLYIDGQEITDVVSRRMSRTANITGGGYVYG